MIDLAVVDAQGERTTVDWQGEQSYYFCEEAERDVPTARSGAAPARGKVCKDLARSQRYLFRPIGQLCSSQKAMRQLLILCDWA